MKIKKNKNLIILLCVHHNNLSLFTWHTLDDIRCLYEIHRGASTQFKRIARMFIFLVVCVWLPFDNDMLFIASESCGCFATETEQ